MAKTKPLPDGITDIPQAPEAIDTKDLTDLVATKSKKKPANTIATPELPPDFKQENAVFINGKWIEIKPTIMKYFRNRATAIYNVLRVCPLHEFMAYKKGTFDDARDSDQILYDFLVAVFNDEQLVRECYDSLDVDTYEKILEIFGRLNHIIEKEEANRKNMEAQGKKP